MAVEAVVWDVGNVLIEWQPERFYDRRLGEAGRRAMFGAVDLHGMNDRVDRGAVWADEVAATARLHPDHAEAIGLWHSHWHEIAGPVIPGSAALLRALKAHGVPCLALTNFGRETYQHALPHFPILAEFDLAFVSGRMGMGKPDAAIYAAVERETGRDPATLLFADDREENVAAAAARGWQVHRFDGPEGLAGRLVAEGLLPEAEARAALEAA